MADSRILSNTKSAGRQCSVMSDCRISFQNKMKTISWYQCILNTYSHFKHNWYQIICFLLQYLSSSFEFATLCQCQPCVESSWLTFKLIQVWSRRDGNCLKVFASSGSSCFQTWLNILLLHFLERPCLDKSATGMHTCTELRNVISFTQSKSFKPDFTPRKARKSRQI